MVSLVFAAHNFIRHFRLSCERRWIPNVHERETVEPGVQRWLDWLNGRNHHHRPQFPPPLCLRNRASPSQSWGQGGGHSGGMFGPISLHHSRASSSTTSTSETGIGNPVMARLSGWSVGVVVFHLDGDRFRALIGGGSSNLVSRESAPGLVGHASGKIIMQYVWPTHFPPSDIL